MDPSGSSDHTPYTLSHLAPAWAKDIAKKRESRDDNRVIELVRQTKPEFKTITETRAFQTLFRGGPVGGQHNFKVTGDGVYFEDRLTGKYTHHSTLVRKAKEEGAASEAAIIQAAALSMMEKARDIFSRRAAPPTPAPPRAGSPTRSRASERAKGASPKPAVVPHADVCREHEATIKNLADRVVEVSRELGLTKEENDALKTELKKALAEKEEDQATIAALKVHLKGNETKLMELTTAQADLNLQLEAAKAALGELRGQHIELKTAQQRSLDQIRELTALANETDDQLTAARSALGIERAANVQLQDNLQRASLQVAQLEAEVSGLRATAAANASALATLRTAEAELGDARLALSRLQEEVSTNDLRIRELEDNLSSSESQKASLELLLENATSQLRLATDRIGQLESALRDQLSENSSLSAQISRLKGVEGEASDLRGQLTEVRRTADATSLELQTLKADIRACVSALAEATGMPQNTDETYQNYLRRIGAAGRGLQKEIGRLQAELLRLAGVQRTLTDVTAAKEAAEGRLSTLTATSAQIIGTLRTTPGVSGITRESTIEEVLEAANAALVTQQRQIDVLTRELQATQKRVQVQTDLIFMQRKELNTTHDALKSSEQRVRDFETTLSQMTSLTERLEGVTNAVLAKEGKDLASLSIQISALDDQVRGLEGQLEIPPASSELAADPETAVRELTRRMAVIHEKTGGLKDSLDQERATNLGLRGQLSGNATRISALEHTIQELTTSADSNRDTIAALESQLEAEKVSSLSQKATLDSLRETLESTQSQLSLASLDLGSARSELTSTSARIASLEEALRGAAETEIPALKSALQLAIASEGEARNLYLAAEAKVTELSNALDQANLQIEQLRLENEKLNESLQRIRRRDDRLEREVQYIETILGIGRNKGEEESAFLARLEKTIRSRYSELERATQAFRSARIEIDTLKAQAVLDKEKMQGLQSENDRLRQLLEAKSREIGKMKAELARAGGASEALEIRIAKAEKNLDDAISSYSQHELAIAAERKSFADRSATQDSSIQRLQDEIAALQAQRTLEGENNKALELRLQENQAELARVCAGLEAQLAEATSKTKDAEKSLAEALSSLRGQDAELRSEREKSLSLSKQLESWGREYTNTLGEVELAIGTITEGTDPTEICRRLAEAGKPDLAHKFQQIYLLFQRAQEAVRASGGRIQELEAELASRDGTIHELKSLLGLSLHYAEKGLGQVKTIMPNHALTPGKVEKLARLVQILKERAEAAEATIGDKVRELESAKRDSARDIEALNAKIKEAQAQLEDSAKSIEGLQRQIRSSQAERKQLESQIAQLHRDQEVHAAGDALNDRLMKDLGSQLKSAQKRLSDLEKANATQQDQIEDQEYTIQDLHAKIQEWRLQNEALTAENAELRENLTEAAQIGLSLSKEHEALKAAMEELKATYQGRSDLLETLTTTMRITTDDDLQRELSTILDLLKGQPGGDLASERIRKLQQNLHESKTAETELREESSRTSARLLALQKKSSDTETSLRAELSSISALLGIATSGGDLEGELSQINSLLSGQADGATLSAKIRKLQRDLEASRSAEAEFRAADSKNKADLAALQASTTATHSALQAELSELKATHSTTSAALNAATEKCAALSAKAQEDAATIQAITAERNALKATLAGLRSSHAAQVADLERRIQSQDSTIHSLQSRVSGLESALRESESAKAALIKQNSELQTELSETKARLEKATAKAKRLSAENRELAGRVQKLEEEKSTLVDTVDAQRGKIVALRFENLELKRRLRDHEIRELERAERGDFKLETEYEALLAAPPDSVPAWVAEAEREADAVVTLFMELRRAEESKAPLELPENFLIDHLLLTGAIQLGYESGKATLMIDESVLPIMGVTPDQAAKSIAEKGTFTTGTIAEKNFIKMRLKELPSSRGPLDNLFSRFVELYLKDMARTITMGQKTPTLLTKVIGGLKTLNTYCTSFKRELQAEQARRARVTKIRSSLKALKDISSTDTDQRALLDALTQKKALQAELREIESNSGKRYDQILIDSVQKRQALAKHLISMIALINSLDDTSSVTRSTDTFQTREALIPTKRLLNRLLSEISEEILPGAASLTGLGAGAPSEPSPPTSRRASRPPSPESVGHSAPEWGPDLRKRGGSEIVGGGGRLGAPYPRAKPSDKPPRS
jgi:chromosome segregation ATPase